MVRAWVMAGEECATERRARRAGALGGDTTTDQAQGSRNSNGGFKRTGLSEQRIWKRLPGGRNESQSQSAAQVAAVVVL